MTTSSSIRQPENPSLREQRIEARQPRIRNRGGTCPRGSQPIKGGLSGMEITGTVSRLHCTLFPSTQENLGKKKDGADAVCRRRRGATPSLAGTEQGNGWEGHPRTTRPWEGAVKTHREKVPRGGRRSGRIAGGNLVGEKKKIMSLEKKNQKGGGIPSLGAISSA